MPEWRIVIGREGARLDGAYDSEREADKTLERIFQEDWDHDRIWLRTDQPSGYVRLSSIDMFTIHEWD